MNNNAQIENSQNNMAIRIMKGLVFAFIITLISMFLFAIVLTYSSLAESVIPIVMITLTFISILIGSMIGVRKINKNGMMNGAVIGGIYVLLLYIFSSLLNTGFHLNIYSIIMMVAGILSGMIGGIIGVNI